MSKLWSAEEDAILLLDLSVREKMQLLPGRTQRAVEGRQERLQNGTARTLGHRPPPENFSFWSVREGTKSLQRRYGVGGTRIAKWRAETGTSLTEAQLRAIRRAAVPATNCVRLTPSIASVRDASLEGCAADYLRCPRGGGWRVHHCDEWGAFKASGTHFRVGRMVMSPEEMIVFAERKGFRALGVVA